MIHHLDNLLRYLLVNRIAEISEEQVRFQPLDDSWRGYVSSLNQNAINIYLADVRENRKLRSNERVRNYQNGNVIEEAAPARIDCHYLITTWSPASSSTSIEPVLDEHALLYEILRVLMRQQYLVPQEIYSNGLPAGFPGEIADAELPVAILPVEGFSKLPEFWTSVAWRWKPVIYLVVTLPVLPEAQAAGPMVTTRGTKLLQSGKSQTAETWFRIGGRVFEAAEPAHSIEGAVVKLVEKSWEVSTNSLGQYVFGPLPAGTFTIEVSKEGFMTSSISIEVPGNSPTAFDIGLIQ